MEENETPREDGGKLSLPELMRALLRSPLNPDGAVLPALLAAACFGVAVYELVKVVAAFSH